ncbi:MAG: hypothetical protein M3342_00150 [Bacteroidota bacterium]|nr:hypothetical protein [Bacteroidota bacterium]
MTPRLKKGGLLAAMLLTLLTISYAFNLIPFTVKRSTRNTHTGCTPEHHVCVMKTMFNLEDGAVPIKRISTAELPTEVKASINAGAAWLAKAQSPEGGWGAGMYTRQDIRDPHAVAADPATTSLVCLALLRTGNSLTSGTYQKELIKAIEFLLKAVEQWSENQPRLTILSGTQPQRKLGDNIDAILTVQYFTNLLKYHPQHPGKERIEKALQKCVRRIEQEQDTDGGWKGGGWAPVLQSALADHALESAKDAGIAVDTMVMKKSKGYQKSNFDTATKSAITGKAAGVMLYSLSSTTRSSAQEAKKAKEWVEKGKKEGKLTEHEGISEVALEKAGASPAEAKELVTAYLINENTKKQSVREDVMQGFGSNGGEELISYLMTGEAILMQGNAAEWKQWYETMSKKVMAIQQQDGSWEGHHCITSPVFCTAAALLILSINNDLDLSIPKQF